MHDPYSETPEHREADCHLNGMIADERAYLKEYPGLCHACGGTGTVVFYAMVGDPAHGSMPIPDICSCVDGGRCPRCGEDNVAGVEGRTVDYFRCRSCNWTDSPGCANPDYAPVVEEPAGCLPCTCGARERLHQTAAKQTAVPWSPS